MIFGGIHNNSGRKPAYTLVELVVAVTILASLSIMASGFITTTTRAQRLQQVGTQLTEQAVATMDLVERDLRLAPETTFVNPSNGPTYLGAPLRVFPLAAGEGMAVYFERDSEQVVMCVQAASGTTPRRLVRMRVAGDGTGVAFVRQPSFPLASPPRCTVADMAILFTTVTSAIIPRYLTPLSVDVQPLQAWPVWSYAAPVANYAATPLAVRVQLVLSYWSQGSDARAQTLSQQLPPRVHERTVVRVSNRFSNGSL